MSWNIGIERCQTAKPRPPADQLGFGRYFTDHMFVASYSKAQGWHDAKVVPYGPLAIDPGAAVLHYGQALFEGLKAFRHKDGVAVFRPRFNWKRMTDGAARLCMEAPPEELWQQGLRELLKVDRDWVPSAPGTSLYIRPTLIATEAFLGVRPSAEYLFFILLSPVGNYYAEGANAVRIWVEKEFTRAAPGGLGATKAAANYAGSLKAALKAKEKGYSQVLWLDVRKDHVEEVGTMNVFFVIGDEVVTPKLDGTILEGGTRQVVIDLLRRSGRKVTEREVKLSELRDAAAAGTLKEAFGTGTAAVISPIGELASDDFRLELKGEDAAGWGRVATDLYRQVTGIQTGALPDPAGWLELI